MNDNENLRVVPLSFWQILELTESGHEFIEFIRNDYRVSPNVREKGFYNQSSISPEVDKYLGIRTMGRCYTKMSFEIKIPHSGTN
jgi:hypothetical protein